MLGHGGVDLTGQFDKAFQADELYLTKYPKGDDFDAVVESMYKIAKSFLEANRRLPALL